MITKLEFFGCSVTAGNELWEEKHIPNYKKLTFAEARKATVGLPHDEVVAYNKANSFPALVAKEIGCEFVNHGIPGISNKEIAGRAIANLDFTMLMDGFKGAWEEGIRYAKTLDLINNLQNEATLKSKIIDNKIAELKGLIRLNETDLVLRQKYLDDIKMSYKINDSLYQNIVKFLKYDYFVNKYDNNFLSKTRKILINNSTKE
jgi:hypothetical protein